jgi:hypothetical protein
MSDFSFDGKELLTRIFKYFFEGLIVAIAAYLIPGKKMLASEILTIGIIAAATFSILDLWAPAIGSSVRLGSGFGIGANLVGFGVAPKV